MLEQQRLEYLQAMGIQLWMPREPVAQAAESIWYANQVDPEQISSIQLDNENVALHAGSASKLLPDSFSEDSLTVDSASLAINTSTDMAENISKAVISEVSFSDVSKSDLDSALGTVELNDSIPPVFELYFALWPCGTLWVSSISFTNIDLQYQSSVSFSLLNSSVLQPNFSHFKWPYIESSNEDQSIHVALRALKAQWEYLQSQGLKNWISADETSLEWGVKVGGTPLHSVSNKDYLVSLEGKKSLFEILHSHAPDVMTEPVGAS